MKAGSEPNTRHVVFHSLSHATAALGAALQSSASVSLCTARGAVRYAGPDYLFDIVRLAAAETNNHGDPEANALIDCRDEPALVFAALRVGWRGVIYSGPKAYRHEVDAAVASYRATLVTRVPRTLDLLDESDPVAACLKWYAG